MKSDIDETTKEFLEAMVKVLALDLETLKLAAKLSSDRQNLIPGLTEAIEYLDLVSKTLSPPTQTYDNVFSIKTGKRI